jgi:hypothetical protein
MSKFCLMVMTDGRDDILARTLPVAAEHVPYDRLVIHDDTGDSNHRQMIAETYSHLGVEVIGGDSRRGFGGLSKVRGNMLVRSLKNLLSILKMILF